MEGRRLESPESCEEGEAEPLLESDVGEVEGATSLNGAPDGIGINTAGAVLGGGDMLAWPLLGSMLDASDGSILEATLGFAIETVEGTELGVLLGIEFGKLLDTALGTTLGVVFWNELGWLLLGGTLDTSDGCLLNALLGSALEMVDGIELGPVIGDEYDKLVGNALDTSLGSVVTDVVGWLVLGVTLDTSAGDSPEALLSFGLEIVDGIELGVLPKTCDDGEAVPVLGNNVWPTDSMLVGLDEGIEGSTEGR